MNSSEVRAVAIVGVGALLPDAPNATALWENVCGKRYSIVDVPPDRWSVDDYFDPDPAAPDKTYSKIGGWVRGFSFDWKKYRVPPRVAEAMDESQKWAVTVADMALTDYGYPNRHLDLERTGAVIGTAMGGETHDLTTLRASFPEYARALVQAPAYQQIPLEARGALIEQWRAQIGAALPSITEDSMPGELPNVVAGRIANVLNLRGPNFITDAACASSFAAIQAATDLLYGADGTPPQCDAVLAGGVDRNMGAPTFIKFCKIGALSATGTRPFSDGADGFVMGEGAGIFLLKRLSDAERDGDRVYAVIRGIGASSDGRGKGITAPNPAGQQLAIARAWQQAGLDPTTATLIEAHGTSTRVGDVVEVESLTHIFCGARPGSIALGSIKSNIGHLKAAAGAAGLLKTVMALHHKTLPPTLNAHPANRNIPFENTPFHLNSDAAPWEARAGTPRRAGVSAYGFGGTNFHLVVEEYVPGGIVREPRVHAAAFPQNGRPVEPASPANPVRAGSQKMPLRGILALAGQTPEELAGAIAGALKQVGEGWTPPLEPPCAAALAAPERLVIDFGDHTELQDRLVKAEKAARMNAPAAWKALQAQGIFRGSGPKAGKLAFLFPGQGSQYLNMGRALAATEPTVTEAFSDADTVMEPILGQSLTSYIFVDETQGPDALEQSERDLMQTAITQPAMLTMDVALERLLQDYGFAPDLLMGHSLGEYAALIVSGIMPFADALEAAAARGREMTRVSMDDNGWMAAVMAPLQVVDETLSEVDGYVVAANVNSFNQSVIGGESKAVEEAIRLFQSKGYQAQRIPVSHAFHTRIVAPASGPLRQVLERLHIYPPRIPLVANVTGERYPTEPRQIIDMLEQQIASPVQWVKGLQTLYAAGARTFVEVGPKKALKGFVDDVLGARGDVLSLFTNHPKVGELASFNQAICGLYAAGYGAVQAPENAVELAAARQVPEPKESVRVNRTAQTDRVAGPDLVEALAEALQRMAAAPQPHADRPARVYDRNAEPAGSVVITGTGLGLPGAEKSVMDPENAQRLLRGEQFIDLIPERFRNRMVDKRITRLVKGEDGSGHFEVIDDPADVVKLAGRPGSFNLSDEYGVPEKLVEAFDITTQLAMAAGLDALREAGIPLVQTYRSTTTGKYLPERWLLPEPLRDETGVIFASVFPGGDYFAGELSRYYVWRNRREQLAALEDLRSVTSDANTLQEIWRRAETLRAELEREPYTFDRRFLFGLLSMGHSQFAEYIGARGPNTQVNAACATTAQAVAIAEDWIRAGRCRRVIVIGGDSVTSDNLLEWVACGFLASGAAATDDNIAEAALPFDRRRHGTIMGMGACALVVESEDAVRERGMRGIVELLNAETCNSAFHGTRLDVDHISGVMDNLVTTAERRFGLDRNAIAARAAVRIARNLHPCARRQRLGRGGGA